MNKKYLISGLLVPLIGFATPVYAQHADRELRELYNLCSRFPENSRCEGYDIPVPLEGRSGEDVRCALAYGNTDRTGKCKISVVNGTLTVYLEEGEPIELLNDQRASVELKISPNQIFALNYQLWNEVSGGFFTFSVINQDYSVIEVAFITDVSAISNAASSTGSTVDAENHSNSLKISTTVDFGTTLHEQLSTLVNASAETLQQQEIIAATATATTNIDVAENVRRLLDTKECVRCDLRGANLENANLDRANLEGANLAGANLNSVELDRAYLVGANFSGATLTEADLENSQLLFATLTTANLQDANLQGTNLQGANLQDANLTEARLIAPTVLRQANLTNATLSQAQLAGANLDGANLTGANLTRADLSDITIELRGLNSGLNAGEVLSAIVIGTDAVKNFKFITNLTNANLQNANLTGANLEDALLNQTNLSGANLSDVELESADLTNANLCGATMPDGSASNQGC